jgi:hypothetical protein
MIIVGIAMSLWQRLKERGLLIWVAVVPLAVCLVFSLFHLAIGNVLSRSSDLWVWGIAIFVVLAGLGLNLELNMVKGYYRSYLGLGLLVTICGMAIGVVTVILGLVGTVALVPISVVLLSLCVVFSPDFFGMDRVPFVLRLIAGGLIVGLLVALAVFLF